MRALFVIFALLALGGCTADTKAPDTGFFTCQQHFPENFWNPAFQNHPNGVTGIAGVVLGTPLLLNVTNMLAPQAYLRITSVGLIRVARRAGR